MKRGKVSGGGSDTTRITSRPGTTRRTTRPSGTRPTSAPSTSRPTGGHDARCNEKFGDRGSFRSGARFSRKYGYNREFISITHSSFTMHSHRSFDAPMRAVSLSGQWWHAQQFRHHCRMPIGVRCEQWQQQFRWQLLHRLGEPLLIAGASRTVLAQSTVQQWRETATVRRRDEMLAKKSLFAVAGRSKMANAASSSTVDATAMRTTSPLTTSASDAACDAAKCCLYSSPCGYAYTTHPTKIADLLSK